MSRLQIEADLVKAGIQLRGAVVRGDLDEVRNVLASYCNKVEACLNALKGDGKEIKRLAEETNRTFDWVRGNVSALRARAALDLRQSLSGQSYTECSQPARRTWAMEG